MCKNVETWEKYKKGKKDTKKMVSETKTQAFDELYQSLGTKEGENLYISLLNEKKKKRFGSNEVCQRWRMWSLDSRKGYKWYVKDIFLQFI